MNAENPIQSCLLVLRHTYMPSRPEQPAGATYKRPATRRRGLGPTGSKRRDVQRSLRHASPSAVATPSATKHNGVRASGLPDTAKCPRRAALDTLAPTAIPGQCACTAVNHRSAMKASPCSFGWQPSYSHDDEKPCAISTRLTLDTFDDTPKLASDAKAALIAGDNSSPTCSQHDGIGLGAAHSG